MLDSGDKAPALELPDSDMNLFKTEDYLDRKNLVLYFYPKDDTPGCTMEALEFTDLMSDFEDAESLVLGISKDNCMSHGAFRDKYGLTVRLLADVEGQVCDNFGVWQEREKGNEIRMTILRSTFIIDKQGVIRHAMYDVKPKGHAAAVLELVRKL